MKRLMQQSELTGRIHVLSGLRIGAGSASIEIGGLDNPILRHPMTHVPYVPGSSLKGRMRSLLETTKVEAKGFSQPSPHDGPCGCGKCVVCCLFGCGEVKNNHEPTRLLFRDSMIAEEHLQAQRALLSEGVFYSEVKSEVTMDRTTGRVAFAGPRNSDRIMAGTLLELSVVVRVFEGDDVETFKNVLVSGMRLIEGDGIGGSVSRGYGRVRFEDMRFDNVPLSSQNSH